VDYDLLQKVKRGEEYSAKRNAEPAGACHFCRDEVAKLTWNEMKIPPLLINSFSFHTYQQHFGLPDRQT
jgi:hypothetical protein